VFDPNSAEAKDSDNKECYANPGDPATWGRCSALKPPFVWWDVLPIPSARQDTLDCVKNESGTYECPSSGGSSCSLGGNPQRQRCTTVKIPGYFKMRSRFVDFPGVFVQHCHILAHEDIGMMQLIEVYTNPPGPTKKITGFTHY
jgi:hypothetical protein